MPTRNVLTIAVALFVSLACYSVAGRNRYARIIAEALDIVHHEALIEIPERELFNAAMEGMLSELDENSGFISQDQFQTFDENLNQEFVGVGMSVQAEPDLGYVRVISPMPGTPAFRAGFRVGDKILEIDGMITKGLSQERAINMIRGPKGESVEFLVQRAEESETFEVSVERDAIAVPSIYGDTRNPDGSWNLYLNEHPRIGYIRLLQFGKRSSDELREALSQLEGQIDGLILDLRNNPGGLLEKAVDISDMFIDREVLVVLTKRRDEKVVNRYYATSKTAIDSKIPMVVLVNQYSASAAEIVAACLQDHNRAVVVGMQTYGKGTVQDLIPLEPQRSVLRLTTASYWRPSGQNIDRTVLKPPVEGQFGVRPDEGYEVVLSDEEFERVTKVRFERDQDVLDVTESADPSKGPAPAADPQLTRAVKHLQLITGNKSAA